MWAQGASISSAAIDERWHWPPYIPNPLSEIYRTRDNRLVAFSCLQGGYYWSPLCQAIGRPELATDPRFSDHDSLMAHNSEAKEILREVFDKRTLDEWREALAGFPGQWTVVQDVHQVLADPQAEANGYLQSCKTATGVPYALVTAPVQFDGRPAISARAPDFNEHGDAILADLGFDSEKILDLKVRRVVA
jgi:crotonobetainyl-CoA:carnitine CoA-transferase CaiB-like acyl-CoA transferase